jgi:ABC-2 type transport system permease protein
MSVGLGAVYPNLKEDNPSKIVSGFGGTLNLILSLIYVVVVVAVEAVLYHLYMTQQMGPAQMQFWALVGTSFILTLTAVAAILPMRLGLHALRRIEV